MHINPRVNQIIREKESPIIDFTNSYLNSSTSVKAIAEAIKLMGYTVLTVKFVNNSLRTKDACALIDSIERHLPNLVELDLSKNDIGLDGARYLA